MSDTGSPHPRPLPQVQELVASLAANTKAMLALAVAVGALTVAVKQNSDALAELAAGDEDDACPDCGDPDCDGDCEEEDDDAPPRRRRGGRR